MTTSSCRKIRPITLGRWSGGGTAVLENVMFARRHCPSIFDDDPLESIPLVMRNFAPLKLLLQTKFLLMPQYAVPWTGPYGSHVEAARNIYLRLAGDISRHRASGILRISSAIPDSPEKSAGPLHNVLDEGFESALAGSRALETDAAESVVSIGGIISYKNLERLIEGFIQYRSKGGRLTLRIYGPNLAPRYLYRVRESSRRELAIRIDPRPVARTEVLALLRDCHAAIFPALVEASPVGLLEALCLSPRVAASNIQGHVELVNNRLPQNSFFDPSSILEIEQTLWKLEDDPPNEAPSSLRRAEDRHEQRTEWAHGFARAIRALLEVATG